MTDEDANRPTVKVRRRQLLRIGEAGAIAAAAGCIGFLDDGSDHDVPGYASYVPVTENDDGDGEGGFVAYLDIAALEALPDSGQSGDGGQGDDSLPEDPLLAFPLSGAIAVAFLGAFSLAPLGFGSLFDSNGDSDVSDAPIEEMLLSGSGLILTGEFDTDALHEQVTAENEDSFRPALEQVDERSGYTIYASPDSTDDEESRYAISSEDILVGTQEELDRAIETAAGDRERAHEAFEEFAWLLSEAGDGMIVTGGYAPDGELSGGDTEQNGTESTDLAEFEEIESANGGVGSITFDDDAEELTAQLALSFEDLSEETRSDIEDAVGSLSEDASVDFDDGRVTAEATYREETFEEATGSEQETSR